MSRTRYLAALLALTFSAPTLAVSEQDARVSLANKLRELSKHFNMREGTFADSVVGSQSVNKSDKNPLPADSTYHSEVWAFCKKWMGPQLCTSWRGPYISGHGWQAEQSNLEGTVASEVEASEGQSAPANASGQYAIWKIEKKDGAGLLDYQGALDRKNITKWEIQDRSRRKFEKVGEDTAVRTMKTVVDEDAGGESMPLLEGLRMAGQRFAKMARNRNLSILGDQRAMQENVEVALNADYSTCDDYTKAVADEPDETQLQTGRRRNPQPYLSPGAWGRDTAQRVAECKMLRALPYDAINPIVANGKVGSGNPDDELYESWRARVAIAAIDRVGMDVNSIPGPNGAKIEKYEYTNTFTRFDDSGRPIGKVGMTNGEQLEGYNKMVNAAADGWSEVAARTGLVDISGKIRGFQKTKGTEDAISLNGMTKDMREEAEKGGYVARKPGEKLELAPSDLTDGAL